MKYENKEAFLALANCKRIDILITDRTFRPLLAIDYNKDKKSSEELKKIFKSTDIDYLILKEIDLNYIVSTINNKIIPMLQKHKII